MLEKRIVVKEGFEDIYAQASTRLESLEESAKFQIDTNEEVISAREVIDRVTAEVMSKFENYKASFEHIIADATEEIEVEVPDEEEVAEGETDTVVQ